MSETNTSDLHTFLPAQLSMYTLQLLDYIQEFGPFICAERTR